VDNGNGFRPKILICVECGEEFVFTAKAQQYFVERGYTDDPRRCKSCHTQYKKRQRGREQGLPVQQEADYLD
jgi:hypothetical protein